MQTKKFKNGDRVKVVETGQFGRVMLYQEKSKKYKVLVNKVKHIFTEEDLTEPVTEQVTNSIHHVFEFLYNLPTNEKYRKYGPYIVWGIYAAAFVLMIYKFN